MTRTTTRARTTVCGVAALSGFSGLAYEVVWTRMLSVALGAEMLAAIGVVAGFFVGLAAGALMLDAPIRRARSPWTAFALLEAAVAAWACISVWLLPAMARAAPHLLGADPSPMLHWAVAFAMPAIVLLPATVAMGGTLTALERMVGSVGGPRVSALVFGANTAGAVAGALACVFLLMPAAGLSGTLWTLAACNLACAGAALLLAGRSVPAEPADASGGNRLLVVLVATGALGVAFEVAAIRLAAQILQDTIHSFAMLLAAYLLGTATGALLWQRICRRAEASSGAVLGWLLIGLATTGIATAWALPAIAAFAARASDIGPWGDFAVAALLLLLPAAWMGALFGCLAQAVRDRRGSLGWAVGMNSIGAAAGPALASLLLIPALGAARALIPISISYLLLMPRVAGRGAWTVAALPLALAAALVLRPAPSLVRVPPGGSLIASIDGATATASVVEDAERVRYLEVNGHFRMGGTSSVRSDWRQALVPLLLHPDPRRVLFLGVGTGATLRGAAELPGVDAKGVELSPEVAALLGWFREQPPPDRTPEPAVKVADARRFVAASAGPYDAIVADLFHPALDGSGSLYTVENFSAVRDRLADGGLFCQWLPLYQLDVPSLRSVVRSFLRVFPEGTAWLAHYSVGTPMLALVANRSGALQPDLRRMAERMAQDGARLAVGRTGLRSPIDLMGLFVADAPALAAFAADAPANTDDRPFVALDAQRNVRVLSAHPGQTLRAVLRVLHPDARGLLGPGLPEDDNVRLDAYWAARDRFIAAGLALPLDLHGPALIAAASPGLLDAVRISPEFDPAYEPLLAMARALSAADPPAGRALLAQIDAAAPSRPEAREMMSDGPPEDSYRPN